MAPVGSNRKPLIRSLCPSRSIPLTITYRKFLRRGAALSLYDFNPWHPGLNESPMFLQMHVHQLLKLL